MLRIVYKDFEKFMRENTHVYYSVGAMNAEDNKTYGFIKLANLQSNHVKQYIEALIVEQNVQKWITDKKLEIIQSIKKINPDIELIEADVEV